MTSTFDVTCTWLNLPAQEKALEAYRLTYEKTAGLASKIDLQLSIIRVAFFHSDARLAASEIAKCKELAETGGDWDRRNRLKVYEGLHLLSIRNFKMGGKLLLDTLSTFTATECISFIDFVALCIIAGVLTLDRPDLKKKVRLIAVFSRPALSRKCI